jgi:WD40 repeat protein
MMKACQLTKIVVALGAMFAVCANTPVQASDLFVGSYGTDKILRYDSVGNFLGDFASGGGLDGPTKFVFGPDSTGDGKPEFYVNSYLNDKVLRYNGVTGAFIDTFVTAGSGGLDGPEGLAFGPDGNLYVSSHFVDKVFRYNGTTGAYIDTFVTAGTGGIDNPRDLVFGPDNNLYVGNDGNKSVLRYNGSTGAAMPSPGNSGAIYASNGGTNFHRGLLFGADGNLFVTTDEAGTGGVLRYEGPGGVNPGQLVDIFVAATNHVSIGIATGSDNNLYVATGLSNTVVRYNGTTGALIGNYVTAGSGGLNNALYIAFEPVPEPASIVLLALGFTCCSLRRRLRKSRP